MFGFDKIKKAFPVIVLALLLVPAVILVGIRQLSPKASGTISIQVSPGAIDQSSSPQIGKPVYLSATAVDEIGRPIASEVSYMWGISSNFATSPTFVPSNNLATFTPNSTGSGSLWVSAITSESSAIKYVDVCVGVPCPSYTNPTPISCKVEIYPATANTVPPYSYSSPLDQNVIKVKEGDYYLKAMRIFNNSSQDLGNLTVDTQQLRGAMEPIDIINSDTACKIDKINKTTHCVVGNALAPGRSVLTSSSMVIKVLVPSVGVNNLSTLYSVTSNLGSTQCADMLYYGSGVPTPTPTPRPAPTPTGICIRNNPTVSFTPAGQSGAAGSTLSYYYTVTSNDSPSCSPATISSFTTHNLPGGWSVVFNPTFATINPGRSVSVVASYTSKLGAVPGFYYVYIDPISALPQYSYNQIGRYAAYTVTSLPPTPTPVPNRTPVITTTSLPNAAVGQEYNTYVYGSDSDSGDKLSMKLTIPTGYGLSAGPCSVTSSPATVFCAIFGTPTKSSPSIPVGVSLTDGKATVSANLSLSISKFRPSPSPTPTPTPVSNASPTIVTKILPAGFVGRPYNSTIVATDPDLNDYLTAEVSGLPASLYISGCTQYLTTVRNLTCTISGVPKSPGSFPVKITVSDRAKASVSKTINLSILKKYLLF